MPWWMDMQTKLAQGDWIRYGAAVSWAVAVMVVWLAGMEHTGDPWQDGPIGIGIVVAGLSTVIAVAITVLGRAKDRAILENIKKQNDMILENQRVIIEQNKEIIILLRAIAVAVGAKIPPSLSEDKGGEECDGRSDGS